MILCCGEALIDMLPRQTTDGHLAFAPFAGGAVFNTAIALGRLDCGPGFFCGMSDDLFGDVLRESLDDAGVSYELCPISPAPTTLAFVRLVDGQANYRFYDENSALRMLSTDALPALSPEITALFFGGISLAGEPCGASFEQMLASNAGEKLVMIDPNIRPSFVSDRDAFTARIRRMMAQADIVKLSDEDLHWLEGDGEIKTATDAILARGTKLVLITEGAKGATAFMAAGQQVFVPAQRVEVVDTVGAGDTFNAGFLAALQDAGQLSKAAVAQLTKDDLARALEMGVRCAAITVSRAGANPPRRDEI